MRTRRLGRADLLGLLALLLLAASTRFSGLDLQSLWNDEGTSVALAQRNLATIAVQASQDIHPPLYYFLLHAWCKVWGTSEVAVRSLSAALGVLVVLGTWALTRATLDVDGQCRHADWVAGALVAVAPFQVYYAQEARMYMLVTFVGLVSMWAWIRLFGRQQDQSERILYWLLYGVASISAIYSHYFAFTLLLAQNIAWLVWAISQSWHQRFQWAQFWRQAWRWAVAQVLILVAYVPWLMVSFGSLTRWPAVSEPLSLATLAARVARVYELGIHYPQGRGALLVSAGAALLAAAGVLGRHRTRAARWLLASYAVVPVASMYLLSLSRPMFKPKFLLLGTPAFYILQACGICLLSKVGEKVSGRRWHGVWSKGGVWLLCVLMCAFPARALYDLYTNAANYRDDYRGIVAYIEATSGPEDALLINAPSQVETVDYYYDGSLPEYPLPNERPMDWPSTEARLAEIIANHRRIYAVYWATNESDPQGLIEGWMGAHCYEAMDRWFGSLRLVVYAVPQASPSEIENPIETAFGESIALRGFSVLTPLPEPGSILQVTLYWRALENVSDRYKVFVHLVDAQGSIVAQRDSEPVGGAQPTSTWVAGETIDDNYGLLLPAGMPPGTYTLRVGMYDAETGVRLSTDATSSGSAVDAGTVQVSRPAKPLPDTAIDVQVRDGMSWPGVELVGHSLHHLGHEHMAELVLRPGDVMRLELVWRKLGVGTVSETWHLSLEDWRGQEIHGQDLVLGGGVYPPTEWRAGELVLDIHQIQLPGNVGPGKWRVALAPGSDAAATLQTIRITAP